MCITSDVIFIICTLIGNSYKPISMKEFLELLCSSRKNPYPPYGRSSKIPRGRGVLKVKILEVKYKATVLPESICTLARVNRKGRTREDPRGSRDETVRFTRRNRAVHETKPRLNISRGQKDEAQTQ